MSMLQPLQQRVKKPVPVVAIAPPADEGCERCTPAEACEYLKISRQTLRRYTASGRITVRRYSSQKLIYLKSDLDRFLEDMKVEAA
jgi:excisionase family DNA binding protein